MFYINWNSNIPNIFLFIVIRDIVHCEWSDWTIGTCTKTCGGGRRNNIRTEQISAAHGGDPCLGPSTDEEDCNIRKCPGNAKTILILFLSFC